jgi:arabinofuranosyltransferase
MTPGVRGRDAAIRIAAVLAFVAVVTMNAWLCDDAYITFRQVENLLHGHGFTWNAGERVQAYSHPLWALVLIPVMAIAGEPFFAVMILGIVVSAAMIAVVAFRIAPSAAIAVLACATLALSRAVIDYATSGLENALTHLLIVGIVALGYARTPSRAASAAVCVLAGLLVVNRLDLALIAVPLALPPIYRARQELRWLHALALFVAPIAAWELFAVIYYGSPFPNTAYAKLGVEAPRLALLKTGLRYAGGMVLHDPVGTAAILLSMAICARDRAVRAVGVAIAAYLAYTIWIGGDFMAARFYSPLVVLAVATLCLRLRALPSRRPMIVWATALLPLALLTPVTTLGVPEAVPFAECVRARGPTDERCVYFPYTSLFRHARGAHLPVHQWTAEGLRHREAGAAVRVARQIGFLGYHAGPEVYVVDVHALSDPFLARMPPQRNVNFYPGHFYRYADEEYLASLRDGTSRFADHRLTAIFDRVRNVARGPIFGGERWRDLIWLQLHDVHDEIDVDRWRYAEAVSIPVGSPVIPDGAPPRSRGARTIIDDGAVVEIDPPRAIERIEVSLTNGIDWLVEFESGGYRARVELPAGDEAERPGTMLTRRRIAVPVHARGRLERVRLLPSSGRRPEWSVGDVQIFE